MASAHVSTTGYAKAADCRSTACLGATLSRHDRQKGRPHRGALPHGRWVDPRQPYSAAHLLSRTVPACSGSLASVRLRGRTSPFSFSRVIACKRSRAQSLAHKQLFQSLAYVPHLQAVLSSSLIRCINKCSQARTKNCHSVTRGVA